MNQFYRSKSDYILTQIIIIPMAQVIQREIEGIIEIKNSRKLTC